MDHRFRWAVVLGAVLLAAAVGFISFNAGVSHGLAVSAAAPAAGAAQGTLPPPYYWYRPWGFGFGFFPFGFLLLWFLLFRFAFWGGYRRRWYYGGPNDVPRSFEEWHHRAHERMSGVPSAQDRGTA